MGKPRTQERYKRILNSQRAKDFAELSAQMERRASPLEQAKASLQALGYIVYPEEPPKVGWIIGRRREQTDAQMVELARRLGWEPSARDAKKLDEDADD